MSNFKNLELLIHEMADHGAKLVGQLKVYSDSLETQSKALKRAGKCGNQVTYDQIDILQELAHLIDVCDQNFHVATSHINEMAQLGQDMQNQKGLRPKWTKWRKILI